MHPSSFDKMAAFRRDHLDARRNDRLVIVDLGSNDINGSYRPLFEQPKWRYSIDVVISGQTFEHTEFFWETMFEIARVLKPHGLCCIIAPSSGPEHRFPIDCWRFYPDGLRAMARYAGLDVLEAGTQWTDLAQYDFESNKWHESMLIARKPPENFGIRLRRNLRSRLRRYLSVSDWMPGTRVQAYYSSDGLHHEEDSVSVRVGHGTWEEVSINLPAEAKCAPLRIDFMSPSRVIDIASITLKTPHKTLFRADNTRDFEAIVVAGDAQRVPQQKFFRIKISGLDPQLYLPAIETGAEDKPLTVQLRLRVGAQTLPAA
jgi:hypothetical protein